MKLIECLTKLPSEMELIDLVAIGRRILTVAEIIAELPEHHKNEEGYEVRERKTNYGKTTVKAIGIIGGPNIYNESTR